MQVSNSNVAVLSAGVVYVAAERTGPAEVTCCSVPKVTRFLFGQLQNTKDSRTTALQGVVDALTSVGVQASIVRSPHNPDSAETWAYEIRWHPYITRYVLQC